MAAPTVLGSRLLPIHRTPAWSTAESDIKVPHSAIQSITMGIRVGTQKYAIGYIHKFSFDMKRDNKPIYQIEPYPDIFGDTATASGVSGVGFGSAAFNEETAYWPGEAIEIIPGKMGVIEIKLNRYSLYTGNLMSAMMRATGSGVYEEPNTQLAPNISDIESTNTAMYYVSILQEVRPFEIFQVFVNPLDGAVLWGRKFGGCWFSTIGEEAPDSDKNEPMIENGTVQATYIRPLVSSLQKAAP
jgi:hypothetical protein